MQKANKPDSAFRPWMALPILGLLIAICSLVGFIFTRNTAVIGVVQNVSWQRVINIEEQRESTGENWRDQLPHDATILSCKPTFRKNIETQIPGSTQVCKPGITNPGGSTTTPGAQCSYQEYADYCQYQVLTWEKVNQIQTQGLDLKPSWPQTNLSNGQREGSRAESYTIDFQTKDGIKQYITHDAGLFSQLEPGTQWTLSLDTKGTIVQVSP